MDKGQIVTEACRKFPELPTLTLARAIYKKHKHLFPGLEAVRTAVRYRRGNMGEARRQNVKNGNCDGLTRPNGKAGFFWKFPESFAPDYKPLILDDCNALVLSDLHIPFHHPAAIQAVVEHAKPRNPDLILLNGDVCDFFSLSRFDRNPTESNLRREIELTRQFLGWLRQTFPKARIIYKLGNHDEWLDKYIIRKCVELYGLPQLTLKHLTTGPAEGLQEVGGIEFVDDQRKLMAGRLNIWHGHEIGKATIAPPVNPARGLFTRTLECGIQGHLHKDSMHEETSATGKRIACWSTGCLCGLWPRYARVNKWTHGAAMLRLERNNFNVEPIRVLNGCVL